MWNFILQQVKIKNRGLKEIPSQSYGMSLVIWDHTVLPVTRNKWTHPALTPARQAGTRFTYSGGIEGWVDCIILLDQYCLTECHLICGAVTWPGRLRDSDDVIRGACDEKYSVAMEILRMLNSASVDELQQLSVSMTVSVVCVGSFTPFLR